jgi:hypothetical protein
MKKHPQKLDTSVKLKKFSLTALTGKRAQTMFLNVAYSATVFKTGEKTLLIL